MMNPSSSVWTPATAGDVPRVVELMRDFYAEEKLVYHEERAVRAVSELFVEPVPGRVFLLREGAEVHGYVVGTMGFSLEFGGRFVLLDELYLRPTVRGRGEGRRALACIETWARDQGVFTTRLEVNDHNEKARAIYVKAGYVDERRGIFTKWISGGPV
jgi:GNAT superfamily N-acetyltransferase